MVRMSELPHYDLARGLHPVPRQFGECVSSFKKLITDLPLCGEQGLQKSRFPFYLSLHSYGPSVSSRATPHLPPYSDFASDSYPRDGRLIAIETRTAHVEQDACHTPLGGNAEHNPLCLVAEPRNDITVQASGLRDCVPVFC